MDRGTGIYQALVDALAEKSKSCADANWARNGEAKGSGSQIEKLNAIFAKLTAEERETLAQYALDAYAGGIYDALCELEWYADCRGMKITVEGAELPLSGFEGMGNDFIGRREGWAWPDAE